METTRADAGNEQAAATAALHARKRAVAWAGLIGAAIGAAVAHFNGAHFTHGVVWGGVAAAGFCWLVTRRGN